MRRAARPAPRPAAPPARAPAAPARAPCRPARARAPASESTIASRRSSRSSRARRTNPRRSRSLTTHRRRALGQREVRGERGQRDPALGRDVVQQLALVLGELGVVAAVQRAPDAPVRALKTFRFGTVHDRNEMIGSRDMIEVIAERARAGAARAGLAAGRRPGRAAALVRLRRARRGARRARASASCAASTGTGARSPRRSTRSSRRSSRERRLAWRHLAERLDGKPAPRFAASTDFSIELAPDRTAARACGCARRRCRRAGRAGS